MRRLTTTPCILTVLCLATPVAGSQPPAAQQPPAVTAPEPYVIGPEDVIEVAVWSNPDLSRTVPVRPDGKISLPLLHDVQAGDLTPMQLRAAVTKALEKYVAEPVVSVIVREVHSVKVTVIGR